LSERDRLEARYKRQIIRKMKEVGTYSTSFVYTINVLAKVLADYEATTERFERTGGHMVIKHTNKSGATNIVKNPLYQAIEKLRDDIITYSRELGLTPAGLKRINKDGAPTDKQSPLERVLIELGSK
jgi:phage terminase small subunit